MKINKINWRLISFITCMIILIIASVYFSYAFYIAEIEGINGNNDVIEASTISLVFDNDDNTITGSDITPGTWNETKTFSVTNDGSANNNYNLILKNVSNPFVYGGLVATLKKNNVIVLNNYFIRNTSSDIILPNVNIISGTTDEYELIVSYVNINENQYSDLGKSFSFDVYIDSDTINLPIKGQIITMNVGTGLPTQYRVIKINGTKAEVMAMTDYNVGTTYKFDADGATTKFSDGTEGQQYAGSDIDKLMNETFYKALNETAKSAIIVQNINQYMYGWTSNKLSSGTYWSSTQDFTTESAYYITKVGTGTTTSYATVGNRYVYLLDVKDILDYFDNPSFTKEELNTLLFNKNTSYSTNSTMGRQYLWLRSGYSNRSDRTWSINGNNGALGGSNYNSALGVRPTFTIDLSQIDWSL